MGSITSSLLTAASALNAFQYALGVTENNIGNASTPGYARQDVALQADAFDPAAGLTGGVSNGPLIDTRDMLAENDVWQQSGSQGDANARNEALTALQNSLPVGSGSGLPAALNNFFNEVSAWSTSPNDSGVRQSVMDSASSLAQSFQSTAASISQESKSVSQSITGAVSQINALTTQVANLNKDAVSGTGKADAGLQAQMYSTLENLSGLVNISVFPQSDGTMNVTLSGGEALVLGSDQYALTAASAAVNPLSQDPQATPDIAIQGADGADVTHLITSGTLHGLLQVRNQIIPGLIGDPNQAGSLNQLASTLATTVNGIVSTGSVSPGVASPSGLFQVDPNHTTAAAATLTVDPAMSANRLPAIDSSGVANGVPLALKALANPQQSSQEIQGISYTAFYGGMATQVGGAVNQAQSDQTLAAQSLAQAQSMRQTEQGVSLDTEAINMLQYQSAYQAVAKMVSTLDNMTQSLIDMMP